MLRNFVVAFLLLPILVDGRAAHAVVYDPEARLAELNLTLPRPAAPIANFVLAVRTGNLLFLAGHGECGDKFLTGKVGGKVTIEQAYASARRTGLCLLATVKAEVGDLRKVKRIVKVLGMVNATADFKDHPKVINGCSDLFVAIFGDRGRHARAAVGMGSLPGDASVEIEMVVEIDDGQGANADSSKALTNRTAQATADAQVRKAQDELIDAYLRRDVGALDRLLADEYTFVNDDAGGVADKKQILASFGSGGDRTITSYQRQDDRVRLYGDVAVLTYRYQSTESYEGQKSGGDYRVTRLLVKRDGRWQMVRGQETRVSTTGER